MGIKTYKILSLMVAVIMLLGVGIPTDVAFAVAGEPIKSGDYTYTVDDVSGKATITNYTGKPSGMLVIPETLDGKTVVGIGDSAFKSKYLMGVVLPESLKEIGNKAFYMNMIEKVTIPKGVTSVGADAFEGNGFDQNSRGITDFKANGGGTWKIYSGPGYYFWLRDTFDYDKVAGGISITGYNGTNKYVGIPSSIDGLTVKEIGYRAFAGKGLTGATLPNTLVTIGEGAFESNSITEIKIPDSVTDIKNGAFNTNQISSLTLGNSVVSIGESAFTRNLLQTVTIPSSVKTIGVGAFSENGTDVSSTDIHYDGAGTWNIVGELGHEEWVKVVPYTYTTANNEVTITGYTGTDKDIVIPDTLGGNPVTAIGERAFENKGLTGVTLPNSLKVINEAAFGANNITCVTLPNSVVNVGKFSFAMNKLSSLTLGSVQTIGECAFRGNNLTTVTMPSSVTDIGYNAFAANGGTVGTENESGSIDTVSAGTWNLEGTKWVKEIEKVTVSFDTMEANAVIAPEQVNKGEKLVLTGEPIRNGYKFIGWYTSNTLDTPYDFSKVVNTDITLYAKWEAVPETVTITFVTNGGTPIANAVVPKGSALDQSLYTTTMEGFSFNAWYKDAALTEPFGFTITASADMTLYANWLMNPPNKLTVSFDSMGGSEVAPVKADKYTAITVPTPPVKVGSTFLGWFTDNTLNTPYNFSQGVNSDITLYAKWVKNAEEKVKITFDLQNGEPLKTIEVDKGSLVNKPQNPVKEGYVIQGWRYNVGTFTYSWLFDETKATTDTTIFVVWVAKKPIEPVEKVTVTFNTNGGTAISPIVTDKGQSIIAPANPTKSGYKFIGWFRDADLQLKWNENNVIDASMTLYAKWEKVESTGGESTGGGSTGGSSSGGGGSSTPTVKTPDSSVSVNGQKENAGKETKQTVDGKVQTVLAVDTTVLTKKIDDVLKGKTDSKQNLVELVVGTGDKATVRLTGDIVKKMEADKFDLSIKKDKVGYVIPASEITIDKVAGILAVNAKDLKAIDVDVKINEVSDSVLAKYNEIAKKQESKFVVKPVEFEIVAKTTGTDGKVRETKVSKFSNYVERVLELPTTAEPSKITTGIVFNADGTYAHIPTAVFQKDGKWYAKLNSLTNSTYSVIYNPITVDAVKGHWSEKTVNDMASRLILIDYKSFDGNEAVTRAEFADYIVRSLGLYREDVTLQTTFKDVTASSENSKSIQIASDWGIINGYADGTFKANGNITRQESMVMYARAMEIAKISQNKANKLATYTDNAEVAKWATSSVERTVDAGIFNGKGNGILAPKGTLTQAEALTAVRNLLVKAELISQ